MKKVHYIAMSGIVGCLPEYCQSYDRLSDAIESLSNLWDDYRGVKSDLRKYRIWYSPGIDYCEVVECDCINPEQHNDY